MTPFMVVDRPVRQKSGPNPYGHYLWLKYVNGFDPAKCCAACLRGHKSARVSLDVRPERPVDLFERWAPYLYLCGGFFRYEKNLHVGMVPAPLEGFTVTAATGAVFEFRNLRRVEIPELPAGHGFTEKQAACRNFRFGHSVFGNGK